MLSHRGPHGTAKQDGAAAGGAWEVVPLQGCLERSVLMLSAAASATSAVTSRRGSVKWRVSEGGSGHKDAGMLAPGWGAACLAKLPQEVDQAVLIDHAAVGSLALECDDPWDLLAQARLGQPCSTMLPDEGGARQQKSRDCQGAPFAKKKVK